jgi:hypothetical protein
MREAPILAGVLATMACAALASPADSAAAQTPISNDWRVARERPATIADLLTRIDAEARADSAAHRSGDWSDLASAERSPAWAASSREVWFDNPRYDDRLKLRTEGRLRRTDGSPLPPALRDGAALEPERYDLIYSRGWTESLGQTASGLDVTLTPHVALGVGSRGGSTEAGATIRIGRDLERLVPDGGEAFGERPRWYLYAAGSGRAVGYNFARTRDGDFARSGVSHDSGNFLGDASLGVAMRRGPVQGSFSVVYREIETEGLRGGHGVDTDVSEGLIAFQLSVKPE